MTSLLERPKSKSRSSNTSLRVTLPQVNLLPPEVRAARGLAVTKRWLLISLGLVAVLCVGGYGLALVEQANATTSLNAAQTETMSLQAEIAKYAEVPQVKQQLADAQAAREVGMSTEIFWQERIAAVTAVLPEASASTRTPSRVRRR